MNTSANTSTHWANLKESGFVLGMQFLFGVYRWFGKPLFRVALYPVLTYYFFRNRVARKASLEYLARLATFAPELKLRSNWRTAFRHFIAFADSLIDKIDAWLGNITLNQIVFHNHEELKNLLARKQGVVLLGAHLGNMEVCTALANLRPHLRLNVLIHTRHAEKFNRLLEKFKHQQHVELIQVSELSPVTAMLLNERIENGEFVAIVGDRTPVRASNRFVMASFLGKPAPFSHGPFILAALLKCPVYTLLCVRAGEKHEISAQLFAERLILPRADRVSALQKYAAQFALCLEQQCRRTPLQWFNFYPFWDGSDAKP